MVNRFVTSVLLLGTVSVLTTACIPVALTAGAAAGIAASKEGGVSGELDDARIQSAINDAWFRYDLNMFSRLSLTVEQGNVLITGVVQNPEDRVEAVRLAWGVKGVKQVINEIQVADSEGVTGYLKDTWIGTQLRAKLTANRDIHALNYSIEVVRGVVYVMGVAKSQAELNEVVDIARNIQYVQNVVSYVRVSVEQQPVIQNATTSPVQSGVTSYPINSNGPAASGVSKGMQPIVDDPYAASTGGGNVIGGSASGVEKETLPAN